MPLSSNRFHGEEEREIGFRRALRERHRHVSVVEVSEGHGIDGATGALPALARPASLSAIQVVSPWNLPPLQGVN
ncbi:type 1 periplasmic-binding domain-containing protein [Janthinobacterium rivuli]|uniref:hypothetical protein n=1 Tax=Janthinobacterium sp. FT68W TaxID=2654255 RepID=UPI001D0024C3|nr:hypothetical protein [Janthinobacterium sp. FT68W]